MIRISHKQTEILNYIIDFINRVSYSPTVREIAGSFNITAKAAQDHITSLKKKGYLKSDGSKPRTLSVINLSKRLDERCKNGEAV